jgi:hypothetical protein
VVPARDVQALCALVRSCRGGPWGCRHRADSAPGAHAHADDGGGGGGGGGDAAAAGAPELGAELSAALRALLSHCPTAADYLQVMTPRNAVGGPARERSRRTLARCCWPTCAWHAPVCVCMLTWPLCWWVGMQVLLEPPLALEALELLSAHACRVVEPVSTEILSWHMTSCCSDCRPPPPPPPLLHPPTRDFPACACRARRTSIVVLTSRLLRIAQRLWLAPILPCLESVLAPRDTPATAASRDRCVCLHSRV